jgi:hypothetical protein
MSQQVANVVTETLQAASRDEKDKHFFFEKKKQKTFSRCRKSPEKCRAENKSFLVLFFKKRTPFLRLPVLLPRQTLFSFIRRARISGPSLADACRGLLCGNPLTPPGRVIETGHFSDNSPRRTDLDAHRQSLEAGHRAAGKITPDRPIMRGCHFCKAAVLMPLLSSALSGCEVRGAPSFVIAGSYFPGWMFCALIGIVAAIAIRVGFVVSGLASVLPFQLFVCTSIGVFCALLAWLYWFGQ